MAQDLTIHLDGQKDEHTDSLQDKQKNIFYYLKELQVHFYNDAGFEILNLKGDVFTWILGKFQSILI